MSGYCATGMVNSARAPAIDVTIAITIAKRGRSTKIADSMASDPACRLADRVRPNGDPGPDPLQAVDDDQFAAGQALVDDGIRSGAARAQLDPPDHGPPVLDDEDVDAALVGDEGSLGHHHLLHRRSGLQRDLDELAVPQGAGGVRHA